MTAATDLAAAPAPALLPAQHLDHAAVRSIIIGVMVAMFLAALDQTIVGPALPTIGGELGDAGQLPWVVTAYLLTATAVTPLYGKLSDIHGRRKVLLLSIGVFVAGSLACALAPTMLALVLARGLQGLGGGGLISLAQTTIADVVAPRERARYQGYFATVFVAASVAGPVLGGFSAEHLHWSVIFWVNLPLGALALAMTHRALRRLPRHERPHRRLDLPGAALIVAATVALMLALSWGGSRHPWASAPILALVAAAAASAALFAVRLRTAAEPLLPPSILLDPVVSRGTAAAFFAVGSLVGLSVYLPVYFEAVLGLSPSASGIALIPLMGGVIAGATISGRLMARVRRYRLAPAVGLAAAAACVAILGLRPSGLPLAAVEGALAAVGVGIGTLLPVATVAIQNAVAMHELGTATAVMNFFRALGGALAVAAFGAILLGGDGNARVAGTGAVMPDGPEAFGWTFLAAALCLAAALASLLAMEERPLRGRAPGGPRAAAGE